MNNDDTAIDAVSASRLLGFEQAEFERLLHDDLGQSLVAIRSMAAALVDADADARAEIAALLEQTASEAYTGVYDLMQELRAEGLLQTREFLPALSQVVEDARLPAHNLECRVATDDSAVASLDMLTRRLLLRSIRLLLNAARRTSTGGSARVEIEVTAATEKPAIRFEFRLADTPSAAALADYPRLAQLETRIAAFGGSLETASSAADSCSVCVNLPVRILVHA